MCINPFLTLQSCDIPFFKQDFSGHTVNMDYVLLSTDNEWTHLYGTLAREGISGLDHINDTLYCQKYWVNPLLMKGLSTLSNFHEYKYECLSIYLIF